MTDTIIYKGEASAYDKRSWLQSRTLQSSATDLRTIKIGIWSYFVLLIFEGALRKWLLPGLAAPLLVIRDPIVIAVLLLAVQKRIFPQNIYIISMFFIGILSFFLALFVGHKNLLVALFGIRIILLHFPFMFLIGQVFTRNDVVRMGKIILLLSIPMTILIFLQFYSPQSAWVNRGIGGDMDGSGFDGALGFYRPAGTFSFTLGTGLFYSLSGCFVCYYFFEKAGVNKIILVLAAIMLLLAIPLSMSRALLFQLAISLAFLFITVFYNPGYFKNIVLLVVIGTVGFAILSTIPFFHTSIHAFSTRFENASTDEGGLKGTLVDRFLGGSLRAIVESEQQPFWGYGIGMGTNVGSQLLTGKRVFLISEGEWGRLIGELGPLLGIFVILLRIHLTAKIVWVSYRKLRNKDILPWMLLSFALLLLLQGGWAQPTSLGFCTLAGGLLIASMNTPDKEGSRHTNRQPIVSGLYSRTLT